MTRLIAFLCLFLFTPPAWTQYERPLTVVDSVVQVHARDGSGAGVSLARNPEMSEGLIVTAYHVTQGQGASITFTDGHRFTARPLAADEGRDLALLTYHCDVKRPWCRLATSTPEAGHPVYKIGWADARNPVQRGYPVPSSRFSPRYFHCDALTQPGDSGGGYFDEHGDLVAVIHGYVTHRPQIGAGVPVAEVADLIEHTPACRLLLRIERKQKARTGVGVGVGVQAPGVGVGVGVGIQPAPPINQPPPVPMPPAEVIPPKQPDPFGQGNQVPVPPSTDPAIMARFDKIEQSIAALAAQKGANGAKGDKGDAGDNGKDGVVDPQKLQDAVAAEVKKQLAATPPPATVTPGPPTRVRVVPHTP
jgi:hypothetical protein